MATKFDGDQPISENGFLGPLKENQNDLTHNHIKTHRNSWFTYIYHI